MDTFLIIIKPDAIERGLTGEIISRFERKNYKIKNIKYLTPTSDLAEKHYINHIGKSYFDDLINFIISSHVIVIVMEGDLQVARQIIGKTIPWESSQGTIRGDYSSSILRNLIHCSKNMENAKYEIDLWFN